MLFFFFKQKTAYEMRISDWSSDVCSSDLADQNLDRGEADGEAERHRQHDAAMRDAPSLEQIPGADAADDEGRREVGGEHHVREAVKEGRVEYRLEPVDHIENAVAQGDRKSTRLNSSH